MNINSQRELLLHSSLNQETVLQEFIMYYQFIIHINEKGDCYTSSNSGGRSE